MDCSPPGSSVHGILQTRIPEWVAVPSSGGSSRPRDGTCVPYVSYISKQVLYPLVPPGKPQLITQIGDSEWDGDDMRSGRCAG